MAPPPLSEVPKTMLLFRGQGRGWGHFCNRMLFTAAGWERAPVLTEEKRAQIEESRVPALLRHASRPERSAQPCTASSRTQASATTGVWWPDPLR